MASNGKRYSPEFKFRVVVEALKGDEKRTEAPVASWRCVAGTEPRRSWKRRPERGRT